MNRSPGRSNPAVGPRRRFLARSALLAATLPATFRLGAIFAEPATPASRVAIVRCNSYDRALKSALAAAFDLLGGVGNLVRGKTIGVKINLTGTNFRPFLGKPVGETYMTHEASAHALAALLFEQGARRVRFLESTQSRSTLETSLALADWDLQALRALGAVEFENTRNLGAGRAYVELKVPNGGRMFSQLSLNHSYADVDVLISLAKLKQHITAGVTLSLKNLFGITPNTLYGDEAGREDATGGRFPIHQPDNRVRLPGLKEGFNHADPGARVPRAVADICAARPIQLAIIDGVSTMSGGEGPWCADVNPLRVRTPGVLVVGFNPVSTDAVGTAIMGFKDPAAPRGTPPFQHCDNHLLLAAQAGLGTADLKQIEVVGTALDQVIQPFS